mgnify:CR=1 FL=1
MDGGFHVVPYEPWHLRAIPLQPAQSGLTDDIAAGLPERVSDGWTALVGGAPVACAGFVEHAGATWAWAALSAAAGPYMVRLTAAIRRALNLHPAAEIHMTVEEGFEAGERWARLLGFNPGAMLPGYFRGRDHRAYILRKTTL